MSIAMRWLPASTLLSINSLTTAAGRSMTSPAAIRLATALDKTWILVAQPVADMELLGCSIAILDMASCVSKEDRRRARNTWQDVQKDHPARPQRAKRQRVLSSVR